MLPKAMEDKLNEQIGHELYSAYLYLAMAARCHAMNLPGAAHWTELQAQEELEHAMKFYQFIVERGGQVVLGQLSKPDPQFNSLEELFRQVLDHEKFITGKIHALYELAVQEKDYASKPILHWFIEEQIEEEASASDVLTLAKMAADNRALLSVDRELANRE